MKLFLFRASSFSSFFSLKNGGYIFFGCRSLGGFKLAHLIYHARAQNGRLIIRERGYDKNRYIFVGAEYGPDTNQ
jgi:hypothetical protein